MSQIQKRMVEENQSEREVTLEFLEKTLKMIGKIRRFYCKAEFRDERVEGLLKRLEGNIKLIIKLAKDARDQNYIAKKFIDKDATEIQNKIAKLLRGRSKGKLVGANSLHEAYKLYYLLLRRLQKYLINRFGAICEIIHDSIFRSQREFSEKIMCIYMLFERGQKVLTITRVRVRNDRNRGVYTINAEPLIVSVEISETNISWAKTK